MNFLISAGVTFMACTIGVPLLLAIARGLGLYAIIN